jgi:hypothetical protein
MDVLKDLIEPVHAGLLAEFGIPATREAACLSLAIKYQESGRGIVRDQGDPAVLGPATGMWQFEKMGGVWEILNDGKTKQVAAELCSRAGVAPQPDPVWRLFATEAGDELACAFARLLTWKDPAKPPPVALDSVQVAYDYYDRRWRPGAKRRDAWTVSWANAVAAVSAATAAPDVSPPVEPPAILPDLEARVAELERKVAALAAALR